MKECDLFWEWAEALGALGKMVERKGVKRTHFYHEADEVLLLPIASKMIEPGFPGGAVVENLPANAGDTGSSPGLGRSHMPRSN